MTEAFRSQTAENRKREVDTAEPFEIQSRLIETGWERNKLFSADYWFFTSSFQKLGITRKTTDDLLGSIFLSDNKAKEEGKHPFKMQLEEMLDYYDIRKILIEGSWRKIFGDDMTRKAVQGFLTRWQDKGFSLIISASGEMTVKILNELYAIYQRPYSLSSNTKGFTDDRILAFPSGCRGKTAMDCLEVFGSLSLIGNTPKEKFRIVSNVGEKKASLIYEHFHRGEKDSDIQSNS